MKRFIEKLKEKKGFTLAELLIVVAIIAVLVAIAIPIFTTQLEKSRDSVSVANIRSAYAEAAAAYLTNASGTAAVTEGNVTVTPSAKTASVTGVQLKGTQSGWSNQETQLDGFTHTSMDAAKGGVPGTYTLLFTFGDDGSCTLTSLTKTSTP